jgi:Protein of unknown function (DUF3999)
MTRRRVGMATMFLLVLAGGAASQQAPAARSPVERPIVTAAPGPQKLPVDTPLLVGAERFATVAVEAEGAQARDGLGDLRLFDRDGREVPYLLMTPPARRPLWLTGSILGIAETKKTSGFEVDLGQTRLIDALAVEGVPAPFLKRLMLEGSGDRSRWTVLVREGTLFDLPDDRVRQTTLSFTPGSYRYFRVTWDDTNSARVRTPEQVRAREGTQVPEASPLHENVVFDRQASEPGKSRYRLRLPAAGLPIVAIVLDAGRGDVFRTATALESRFNGVRADPVELGRARLMQTEQGPGAAGALRLPIERPQTTELQLVIEDGSNPPLKLETVAVEFADLPVVYFEASGGPMTARYGNRSGSAPQYDLEAKRHNVNLDRLPAASWGEPHPATTAAPAAPAPAMPDRGAKLDAGAFRYRRSLPEGAAGLVALQLDAAVLSHSRGPQSGFADLRVVDDEGYQIPYLIERRDEPLSIDLSIQKATPEARGLREPRGGNRSAYAVALPYINLPASRLVLETSDRVFRRPLQIGVERSPDRQHRDSWFEALARGEWQHADQSTPAAPMELAFSPRDATRLLLLVNEGDNRPLAITRARLLLPSWRVRFFRPAARLSLIYGREDASAPQYDLALLAPAVLQAEARDLTPAAEAGGGNAGEAILSPRLFWVGLGVAVAILLLLIVRLISSGTAPPPSPPGP